MKVALVNSQQDKAGLNIRHNIEQILDTKKDRLADTGRTYDFFEVAERLIHAENVDRTIDADLIIFLSRHSSTNPVPVLTVHVTGNYGKAELGGSPRTLAPAAPGMMQATLRALAKHCPEGYRVSYEVTHHGPTTLSHSSFFVEIGSTEKEWTDPVAGRAVAESVLDALPRHPIPLIGFGGTHYAARETEIALTSRGSFGHIAHTREIAGLDEEMVRNMIEKSGAVGAYVDRKALSREELAHLSGLLEKTGLLRLSESEIAGIGHISWGTYLSARALAEKASPGSRCYAHGLHDEGVLVSVEIDSVLLSEAVKAGEALLMKSLEKMPLIHILSRDSRLLPAFFTYEEYKPTIINDLNTLCVKIIRSNEITATERDQLIIKKVRFDPHKARELGVPSGPFYRDLSSGKPVEIGGRLITPAMVSSCSEITIHIPGLEKFL